MSQFYRKRKRILSSFLALALILGSLFNPVLPADASNNTISDNTAFHTTDESFLTDTSSADLSTPESVLAALNAETDTSDTEPVSESLSGETTSSDTEADPGVLSGEITASDAEAVSGSKTEAIPSAPSLSADIEDTEVLDQAKEDENTYVLLFDYNGGTDSEGLTSYQFQAQKGESLSSYMQTVDERNITSPYQFTHKWDIYNTDTGETVDANRSANNKRSVKGNYTFKAVWSTQYASYDITYVLDGGSFSSSDSEEIPYSYTYEGNVTLPSGLQKKGYLFQGFYKDAAYKTGVISTIAPGSMGDLTLYAKWAPAAPSSAPTLKKPSNPSTGTVNVPFKKMSGISGYEFVMSTSKKFKNANTIEVKASATSVKLTNMPKGKTYYFKMRAYGIDSVGEKAYSKYSKVQKYKVSKGVKEYKATASSAKLKKCKITAGAMLNVSFNVKKRIKSSDDCYYLVTVDPNTNKYSRKIAQSAKQKTVTFRLPVRDENGTELIQGKYALAVKNGSKYTLLCEGSFISNPETAASYTAAFPVRHSKKGMQGSNDPDLGLSHIFLNLDLNSVLNGSTPYKYNGKTYYFNDPWSYAISGFNQLGLTVTGQFMLTYNSSTKYMILPGARQSGKAYYAINVQEKKARETFEAAMNFLAERYSTSDCHLDNWIIGNEVNTHQMWYYAGNISQKDFMKNYADTYRIMYYAVRSHSKNSRVYICTDHTWTNRSGDWGAKPFMNSFNEEIKAQNKNIQWNLAYHAYPSILTSSATWNDILAPNNENADFVSPKNLSIMTNYVKKNFGSKTRIILSEQGFTSSSGTDVQAAAIAYTYYKAEFDDMIDAVIFRSYQDNSTEAKQNLYFGLLTESGSKKPAYNVFKYMDTKNAEKYTNSYLGTIGISSWKDIAPKYDLKRFR